MAGRRILMGVVGRPHGVRGLVRVTCYAADPASLAVYGPLSDDQGRRFALSWRGAGVASVAELVDGRSVAARDRAAAERFTNTRLYVERDRLPPPNDGEFYLADLIGLAAVDAGGTALGTVATVHDYGAGASLEIARPAGTPLLVPFTRACVPEVDPDAGRVVVTPPAEIVVPGEAEAPG